MSHFTNRGISLSPSRNIVKGENDIVSKKVYSCDANRIFYAYDNFYEKLRLVTVIIWKLVVTTVRHYQKLPTHSPRSPLFVLLKTGEYFFTKIY